MPISGLVLSLSPDRRAQEAALQAIAEDPRLRAGERPAGAEGLLPLVAETATLEEQERLWGSLQALEGVLLVRLAFVDFSDVEATQREADSGPT